VRAALWAILVVILATSLSGFAPSPASARCIMSYCKDRAATTSTPMRSYITNTHRQKVGDLYDPGHERRVQIRDNSRRIIGYVQGDGTVTNTHRQKNGTLDW